jgi:hypothetical protein
MRGAFAIVMYLSTVGARVLRGAERKMFSFEGKIKLKQLANRYSFAFT